MGWWYLVVAVPVPGTEAVMAILMTMDGDDYWPRLVVIVGGDVQWGNGGVGTPHICHS